MAKRVTKTTETSAKQTAATRRTKKTSTPTKKAPTKKTTATSGKTATPKKATTTPKKATTKKPTATAGKTTPAKKAPAKRTAKAPAKKTVKTTLAAVARVKAENEAKRAAIAAKKQGTRNRAPKREYYVLAENAPSTKFAEMGERVRKGEAKWAYYAIDGDIGYHHYEKLK